jgi:hypothetical protein
MRRAPLHRSIALAGVTLSGAALLGTVLVPTLGCARRDDAARGPAVERSGSHGAIHYRLRSQVSPPRVTLGDRAVWRISAQLSGGAKPGTLLRGEADSSLEITPMGPPSTSVAGGGTTWAASFEARGYDIGRAPLPRVSLTASLAGAIDTLEFPPDTLYVDSLTPAMTGAVEPDRGPLPTELRAVDYVVAITAALLVIGAIVAAVVLYRRSRRRSRKDAADAEAVAESPDTVFLRSIEALRGEIGALPRDQFYERLSQAIRVYVAAVTSVPALDRTTVELERELSAQGFDREAVRALGAALRRSDLAKFARHEDPLEEARSALDGAAALAKMFRPRVEEPVAASGPTEPGK